jgi:vacuolar protein-sorting-associated protein 4
MPSNLFPCFQTVILPTRFPQLFTGKRKPFKGILLYGPPGTGKSFLAKAVATEADSTFFSVSSSDLVSKWQGESERLVKNLFEMARESPGGKAIIFIDEVDSLCGSRSEGESDSSRRIKTEFLVQMDGVGKTSNGVLVLGATNVPWELDAAIRRRFEKRVYIPLPEGFARTLMVKLNLGDTPSSLTEDDFERIGEITGGASGSDIKVLVKEALMQPLRTCQKAQQFMPEGEFLFPCPKYPNCSKCPPKLSRDKKGKDYTCKTCGALRMQLWDVPPEKLKAPDVRIEDFQTVLKHAFSSVSPEELKQYDEWTKLFGQEGA